MDSLDKDLAKFKKRQQEKETDFGIETITTKESFPYDKDFKIEDLDKMSPQQAFQAITAAEQDDLRDKLMEYVAKQNKLESHVYSIENEFRESIQEIVLEMNIVGTNMLEEEPELFYAAVREMARNRALTYWVFNVKIGAIHLDTYENVKSLSDISRNIMEHADNLYAKINTMTAEARAKIAEHDARVLEIQNKEIELMHREEEVKQLEAIKETVPLYWKIGTIVSAVVAGIFGLALPL